MNFNTAFWYVLSVALFVMLCLGLIFGGGDKQAPVLLFVACAAYSIHSRLDKAVWLFSINEKGEKTPMLREEKR